MAEFVLLKGLMPVLPMNNVTALHSNGLSLPVRTIDTGARQGTKGTAMQQASALQRQGQGGRLGRKFTRFLYHRRAASALLLLAVLGAAQFGSFAGYILCLGAFRGLTDAQRPLSTEQLTYAFAVSVVIGLGVTVYVYLKHRKGFFTPPKNRLLRKRWHAFANFTGAMLALAVAYAACWSWFLLLLGSVSLVRLVNPSFGLSGQPLLWFGSVSAGLALWTFVAWRRVSLEVLETAEPPELRLVANLKQHVQAFQERAQALEAAFEEAEAIAKKVQRGIELDQEQLQELREQYRLHAQLIELSDRVPAVRTVIAEEHARGARWGLLVNVVVAVVFWAIGLLTDALIDAEAFGDQLRQWLHLG
jgi:hypothetical protein